MKRLIVVDLSNFIFRAFYAIRPLTSPKGVPVNATYGVLTMLLKLIKEYEPTHIFMARDTKDPSFRKKIYDDYKANRDAPPEDLIPQFGLIEELVKKMKIKSLALSEYEADDIIGTAATKWEKDFDEVFLATGDKDLMQFVNDKVKMLDTMKGKILGRDEVFEKLGVWPHQIVDYLSLLGDTSDNIPGMKGVGAKGASKLLAEYETLENCIKNKDKFTNKRVINAFENHLEECLLSKKLIQIVTDLDLKSTVDDLAYTFSPDEEFYSFLKDLGFNSLIKKLQENNDTKGTTKKTKDKKSEKTSNENAAKKNIEHITYKELSKNKDIDQYVETLNEKIKVYLYFHELADPFFLYLIDDNSETTVYLIPEEKMADYFFKKLSHQQINSFVGINLKILCRWYQKRTEERFNFKIFDLAQINYIVDVRKKHQLRDMVLNEFQEELPYPEDEDKEFWNEIKEEHFSYAYERATFIQKLCHHFAEKVEKFSLEKVVNEIDMPLIPVLSEMENSGIKVDVDYLQELSQEFKKEVKQIQKKIEKVSELDVNLNSPKQVAELLFERLGLPIIKKTKTGYSTDSEVLETLKQMNVSDVPGLILRNRELEKLLSTYIDVLPTLVNEQTKRLHTHFHQNVAATGRLSSESPNLQNIPVRTADGRKVRKAFISPKKFLFVSADYSQVELRLLAHFSEDPTMIKAFKNDLDIHAQTASEVLGVPLEEVTSDERNNAKAVNFGLMYGQSSFGLAKQLGISRGDAKDYIMKYFERFKDVKAYLDSLKEKCAKHGYSETYFGRKRFLPDIHSKNRTIRALAERVSVNSPVQGTAADIIKLAMIHIDQELYEGFQTKMLLQVHDELIFEAPEDEVSAIKSLIKDKMENVLSLKVPLKVQVSTGNNWKDLKS